MLTYLLGLLDSKKMFIKCLYFAFICVLGHFSLLIGVVYGVEDQILMTDNSITIIGNPDDEKRDINKERFKRMQQDAQPLAWPRDNTPILYIPTQSDMIQSDIWSLERDMDAKIRDLKQDLYYQTEDIIREQLEELNV